jgi:hypothetical protein
VSVTPRPLANAVLLLLLCVAGSALWVLHARAWSLGGRSPVLNYDTAQYAVAARELAVHGRLATPFALPIELAGHAKPPWPLAVVQPGMVLVEAALFKVAPRAVDIGGRQLAVLDRPDQREVLVLIIPFACYLFLACVLALAVTHVIRRHAPEISVALRVAGGGVVGLAFLLDPEAQHFATSGFTELPFTLLLAGAIAMVAVGPVAERPLFLGLLLGFAGLFRANTLWLAPPVALAATWIAPPGRRARVLTLVLLGWVLPLAPWWYYKWRTFGSPGWDLTRWVIWDGVGGRTWFSIYHLPAMPDVPKGLEAARLLAAKALGNLDDLTIAMLTGPRALWVGALVVWTLAARDAFRLRVAALQLLVLAGLSVLAAAVSIPWLRYLFPVRVVLEAAGLLAAWRLATMAPGLRLASAPVRLAYVALAALSIGWGGWQTARGNDEAVRVSQVRGVPSVLTLLELSVLLAREVPAGEPVMSNLGPTLAWHARRPVLHLALTPDDVEACRARVDFHHVVLVFRDPKSAWRGWDFALEHPADARANPAWNIRRWRRFDSRDGFIVVWFELGPRVPGMAGLPPTEFAVPSGASRAIAPSAPVRAGRPG